MTKWERLALKNTPYDRYSNKLPLPGVTQSLPFKNLFVCHAGDVLRVMVTPTVLFPVVSVKEFKIHSKCTYTKIHRVSTEGLPELRIE